MTFPSCVIPRSVADLNIALSFAGVLSPGVLSPADYLIYFLIPFVWNNFSWLEKLEPPIAEWF